ERRNGQQDDLSVVPTPRGSGARRGLCHVHQSNRPQVRDAKVVRSLPDPTGCVVAYTADRDLGPTGEVFLLHSRWTASMQVRAFLRGGRRACSQGCPRGRAQVWRSSPQQCAGRPHGLWITRLADGADGPTVVRRPAPPADSGIVTYPARVNRSWASYLSVPCRRNRGVARSARRREEVARRAFPSPWQIRGATAVP